MRRRNFPLINLAAVVAILALAALTPAGAMVGLLACVPVLLASMPDDRRVLMMTVATAVAGFAVVASLGHAPGTPLWARERVVPLLGIIGAAGTAVVLQAHRMDALQGRDEARTASEMNRLLMSLLAHDLRSPLVLADQGLEYVEESVSGGYPIDRSLVADLRARLQRSLRAIGLVLTLARADADSAEDAETRTAAVNLREEIGAEVASFGYEAKARGKWLVAELDDLPPEPFVIDGLVLRQAMAIALDNAIRYANPGPVRVRAVLAGPALEVRVEDSGPGLSAHRADPARSRGTGLGLRLCAALLVRAGGSLSIESDSAAGTVVAVRLPASPVTPPVPASHTAHHAGV